MAMPMTTTVAVKLTEQVSINSICMHLFCSCINKYVIERAVVIKNTHTQRDTSTKQTVINSNDAGVKNQFTF